MKNLKIVIALLMFSGLALVSCQNDVLDNLEEGVIGTRATSYTVNDVVGDYQGTLDRVVMNGDEKNPVENRVITVSANNEQGKFNLYLPPFKIGRMPGSITIDAKGIVLNSDGTFSATDLPNTVILDLPFGKQRYKANLIDGKFVRLQDANGNVVYELQFGLETEGKFLFIPVFKAYVHFTGTK